jgi:hypothetical protein
MCTRVLTAAAACASGACLVKLDLSIAILIRRVEFNSLLPEMLARYHRVRLVTLGLSLAGMRGHRRRGRPLLRVMFPQLNTILKDINAESNQRVSSPQTRADRCYTHSRVFLDIYS